MVQTPFRSPSLLRTPAADEGAPTAPGGAAPSLAARLGAPAGAQGPGAIAIARDGTWWHEGRPIGRRELVKLFATVLRREADGGYALVTPAERCPVRVEDAPFIAEEMEVREADGQQVLAFRSNVDRWVEAGRDHPLRIEEAPDSGEPRPYILMQAGLEARLARPVFYRLVDLADYGSYQGSEVLGVWSRGTFFPLDPTGTL